MTIFKQSIPQLESKLADLRAEHAKTMDAFALSRAKIENVAARIVDGSDRSLFTESLAAAQRDQATARAQLEKLESEISETKFALTAAVERPARKASAAQLNEAATAIEKAWRELIPYLDKLTTALADASYRPLMNSSPNLFLVAETMERARAVANGAAIPTIMRDIETLANQITNGERDFALGVPVAEQQATYRKIDAETNEAIRQHVEAAAAAGMNVRVYN